MIIKSLTLINFRRFQQLKIDFSRQLSVLVAPNGAGKTSVLDGVAICLGAYLSRLPGVKGIKASTKDIRIQANHHLAPYMRTVCELTNGVIWDRTEVRDKSKKTNTSIPKGHGLKQLNDYADGFIDAFNEEKTFQLPILLYYGTGRGVFDIPERKRKAQQGNKRSFDAYQNCLQSRTHFRRFVEYFYDLESLELRQNKDKSKAEQAELPELSAIRRAIQRGLPEISNPRGVYPAGIMVDWQDPLQETHALRIEQLSDGFRTTLAMIMDIAARMTEANPHMQDPLESDGVILIDEIELHLHPGWQQRILGDLTRAFPNIQFIVTTHSPQILTTVEPQSIQIIEWSTERKSLTQVDFSKGAESQQLLQDILGVPPRPEHLDIVRKLRAYQELVHQGLADTPAALALRQEVDQWGAEYEPELRRLDVHIRLKAMKRA